MPYGIHINIGNNIITEYASLLIAVFLIIFMLVTKPRKSGLFKHLFFGILASVVAIVLQIWINSVAANPGILYDRKSFTILLISFLLVYGFILMAFINYIYLMSEKRIERKYLIAIFHIAAIVIYISGIIFHVYMKHFYYVRTDGIDISTFTKFYCAAGMGCLTIVLLYCLKRRKYISRIVRKGVYLTVPIDFAVLLLQCFDEAAIFSSLTYVIPFMACYLLFHSNPYDEVTGCQNMAALESRIITNNLMGKHFYIAYIEFPQLMGKGGNIDYENLKMLLAKTCRDIERISNKLHMFRINFGTFAVTIETKEKSDAENYAEQIRDAVDYLYHNSIDHIHYFIGVGGDSKRFAGFGNKWTQFFLSYIREKYSVEGQNVYYFAKGDDFKEYDERYKIEQTLLDIRTKMDPDDERILCYAQPIYSVGKNSFRSAEALMRMCIDGKMIPPDEFISIAEQSNCIHALTVIMMHKVCKAVEKLAENYDFDAVTINCSTSDFVDREFYKEIMDIIHSYKIDQKKIRLELTESMMAESYDAVKYNMNMLNMEGVQLYIDDFGTGYSNLERVLDVPVQTIKFDKSLLYKSLQDERVGEIISYMIEIFKKNGFITLVEGVENESQKEYSITRGFDYIQGYHYAKPMPIENLIKYFNKK